MIGAFIIGSEIIGSFSFANSNTARDSNALFMTDTNVDSPTKISADCSDSNAIFME
jgi:hypothetical protein